MEQRMRRHKPVQVQDQENVYANNGKANIIPTKKHGPVRGALGEINSNVQIQSRIVGKVADVAAEYEKKAALNRTTARSNYNHVQSKVDTGLTAKSSAPTRPPLRREESTAGHAARAAARNKVILKDIQNKPADLKEKGQETKKSSKLATLKENKEMKALKPILKASTESLGKLKLVEIQEQPSIIDKTNICTKDSVTINDLDLTFTLPDNIEDIDAEDSICPFLVSTYIKYIYKYLAKLEDKYSIEPNHLRKQIEITGKMRATLIDWLVEVQSQFSLTLETLHHTIGIIDRYLQVVPNVPRNQLQLVGITAMFIASKCEEIYAPDLGDFVFVTDNAYSKSDIIQYEKKIMSKLGFFLNKPIPLHFLRRFIKAAHGTSKHHHLAKYLVDLCLVEYSMAHYKPSELAAAAICLSLYLLSRRQLEDVWTKTLSYYSGYSLDHIEPIIRKIAKIVVNVENSRHKTVYKKYEDKSFAKVSSLPELRGEAIIELATFESLKFKPSSL